MTDELQAWDNFSGTVKLFPLPNLVLFPAVLQPLHIFEPRYRQMTQDALDGDRHIAMALLNSNWEKDYLKAPAIHPVVCISRIITEQQLEDGRFNILVRGLKRARIREELDTEKMYRLAEVELLEDHHVHDAVLGMEIRKELITHIPAWFPDQPTVLQQFEKLLDSDLTLSMFCDILSYAMPFPVEFKQELLSQTNVEHRVQNLLAKLRTKSNETIDGKPRFPPEFSVN